MFATKTDISGGRASFSRRRRVRNEPVSSNLYNIGRNRGESSPPFVPRFRSHPGLYEIAITTVTTVPNYRLALLRAD
jgi:hypothetical protein